MHDAAENFNVKMDIEKVTLHSDKKSADENILCVSTVTGKKITTPLY